MPERGGDVAGRCLALSHGVLGGGWRDLAGSREVRDGGALDARTEPDLDPAFAKYLQGDLTQVLAEFGQDPGCDVHQEPTHLLGAYRWIVTDGLPREELRLGGEFRPGVSCAYHDEG